MKVVRIPGQAMCYPNRCACCMGMPFGTLRVRKEDLKQLVVKAALASRSAVLAAGVEASRAVHVPYCEECMAHVRWFQMGGMLGMVLSVLVYGVLGLLGGAVVWGFCWAGGLVDQQSIVGLAGIVGGFTAAGIALALAKLRFRPRGDLGRRHACGGDAVEIVRFTSEELVVRCYGDSFAAELIASNPGSAYSRAV